MVELILAVEHIWLLINYDKNFQEVMKWFANLLMYISAILLSISVTTSLAPIIFVGFLLAHIIWAFFAWKIKDNALLAQFLFFIPLDVYAMYIRF